jgi:hypothetical protein
MEGSRLTDVNWLVVFIFCAMVNVDGQWSMVNMCSFLATIHQGETMLKQELTCSKKI